MVGKTEELNGIYHDTQLQSNGTFVKLTEYRMPMFPRKFV